MKNEPKYRGTTLKSSIIGPVVLILAHADIDAFREFITVEAGYFDTVITPAGPRRVAKSWAWKNMAEADFQSLFAAIRRVCWELILSQTFTSIEEADAAAEQLMQFD